MKARDWTLRSFCAFRRPRLARWLNDRSLRPAVSVTIAAFVSAARDAVPTALATRAASTAAASASESAAERLLLTEIPSSGNRPLENRRDPIPVSTPTFNETPGRFWQLAGVTEGLQSRASDACEHALEIGLVDEHTARLGTLVAGDDP